MFLMLAMLHILSIFMLCYISLIFAFKQVMGHQLLLYSWKVSSISLSWDIKLLDLSGYSTV